MHRDNPVVKREHLYLIIQMYWLIIALVYKYIGEIVVIFSIYPRMYCFCCNSNSIFSKLWQKEWCQFQNVLSLFI